MQGVRHIPCSAPFRRVVIDAVSSSFAPPGKNIPSPARLSLPPTDPVPVTMLSRISTGDLSWEPCNDALSLSCSCEDFVDARSSSEFAMGAGPPYRGIHASCGTDKRPATGSGYRATTFAGLKSRSMNVSMASSNLDAWNWETAFRARMRIRR